MKPLLIELAVVAVLGIMLYLVWRRLSRKPSRIPGETYHERDVVRARSSPRPAPMSPANPPDQILQMLIKNRQHLAFLPAPQEVLTALDQTVTRLLTVLCNEQQRNSAGYATASRMVWDSYVQLIGDYCRLTHKDAIAQAPSMTEGLANLARELDRIITESAEATISDFQLAERLTEVFACFSGDTTEAGSRTVTPFESVASTVEFPAGLDETLVAQYQDVKYPSNWTS